MHGEKRLRFIESSCTTMEVMNWTCSSIHLHLELFGEGPRSL